MKLPRAEGERPGTLAGGGRDFGNLLLAEGGNEIAFQVEELRADPRGRKLRVRLPGQFGMEAPLDRPPEPRDRLRVRGREIRKGRLDGAPLEKIAAEAEKDGIRLRDFDLSLPFPLDSRSSR
ncbi:MAG: hypothetical protein LC780_14000 [Acidobacteria bacterium]|nr:hypothetical protein [Acidobacteriota bacterium]